MAQPRLRIYFGPQDTDCSTATMGVAEERQNRVTVSLGEIIPLLADAFKSNRSWLNDFENDEVAISTDLYEVLLAYQHYQRPSA
jgi:hypothetical protein